ncbi:GNAT family N-acetyltransferase [Bacillus sp. AFS031507]|uniref:GNAT family N-acetyltransferase n=1 Tax=Bacillus sp. AFS031507 TaxID=2033496 RepID=UPI000BFE4158|nr:GNAT family N-acetyltransferase [Bacillus sp. AFS031507]PGY06812.1 GNAT family N-acetyltransferase [Bacillus sp. AFS031507]
MDILHKILELDFAYLDTFTNRMDTSWGSIFYNEDQPAYYDANHAHIIQVPENPEAVIEEVLHFYTDRNLAPRFYIYDFEKQARFIEALQTYQFQTESLVSPVQLWNQEINEHKRNDKVTIERVTTDNFHEALEIECSIKELGGREVREKSLPEEFKHPSFTHYLLRYDGVAFSTACLFEHEGQVRLESVATIEEYRGKGLIGELIYFLQEEVKNQGVENFWVFPINERVEKVYLKYGFQTIAKLTTGHAFLSGKSIKEIQGS